MSRNDVHLEASGSDSSGESQGTRFRILFVDPASDGSALADACDAADVIDVDDAAGALEYLSASEADCVVSEYDLPGADGLSLLKDVRTTSPHLPFVMFTAAGNERLASDAFLAGADGYLRKDSGYDALADRLIDLISGVPPPAAKRDLFGLLGRKVDEYGMFVLDTEGRVVDWGEGARRLTGYRGAAVQDEGIERFVPEDTDSAALSERLLERAASADRASDEGWFVRADGSRFWAKVSVRPLREHGALEGFGVVVSPLSGRSGRTYETIVTEPFQLVGRALPDGTVVDVNRTALEFIDLERDAVVGKPLWEAAWWPQPPRRRIRDAVEAAAEGSVVRFETEVRDDGTSVPVDFSIRPVVDDAGDIIALIPEARDITERKRRTDQLQQLNEIVQDLTDADTKEVVCQLAIEAATETLETPFAAVDLYDEATGALARCAATETVEDLPPGTPFAPDHEAPWEAFVDGERAVFEAPADPLASSVVLPLGQHGVLITGSGTGGFTDSDMDAARIFAAHVEVALDSVDRERSLRERTQTLERRTERLERLNRLNDVIRGLTGALIDASSREDIERDVCEELTEAGPYQFAWIGSRDPVTDEIRPEAWGGAGEAYLEAVTVTVDERGDQDPAAQVVRSREASVIDETRTEPPLSTWRKEALSADFHSAIAVPLVYEDALYGVLNLYADESGIFDEVERNVITELGEIVGYAINAAERKQALLADRAIELDFRLQEPALELYAFVQEAGERLRLEGIVPADEGPSRLFFTLEGGSPEVARQFAADSPAFREFELVSEDPAEGEAFVFEAVLEGGIVVTVIEHGAAPQEVIIEENEIQVVVELPSSRGVREFAEMFESKYDEATLVARRKRDRPIQTESGFREGLEELLTDQQLSAARTAYLSGYFEWPRENTGEDVADSLGVSQPTFNRHLRECQRKLFELLFDPSND